MSTDRFIAAAQDGYLDLLQSATKRDLNAVDEDGRSATLWAANNGNLEALRLIVGRGGDVEKSDYLGFTALHLASKGGHLDVVCFLVNWGCNLYALDNEQHTALDLAELVDKQDIVKILDTAIDKQMTKNPKKVSKFKEDAIRSSDRNRKLYERLQEEAARRAAKEQRSREAENDFRAPEKRSFIKTLTMRIKGNTNKPKAMHIKNQNYSNMVGVGVAKRVSQKKAMPGDEGFKVSEMDDSGKRTIRSLQGGQGIISGKSPNVMYMTNRDHPDAENTSNRPALQNVFGMKSNAGWKSKSESDLLSDSGVEDSAYSDPDEDRETPGLFSRPGFGNTAFLGNNAFINTMMHSFETGSEPNLNGHIDLDEVDQSLLRNGEHGNLSHEFWDPDEVENLDDDEDETEFSALETFLVSSGLHSYIAYFTREEIDLDVLMKLSDSELKEQLGLQLGPRKKLQEAISRRKERLNTPKAIKDSYL